MLDAMLALKLRGLANEIRDMANAIDIAADINSIPPALAGAIEAPTTMPPLACPPKLSTLLCPTKLTVEDVICATAVVMKMPIRKILSRSREQRTCFVRQVSMSLCRQLTEVSFPRIGAMFGRDHSTVIHACRKIGRRAAAEGEGAMAIRHILDAVHALLDEQAKERRAQIENLRQNAA